MTKKQTVDIGNRLKKLRGTVPQGTVARYAGITVPVYSTYETGRSEPSLYTVSKLAEFFGVSVDYLINGDGESDEISEIPIEKIAEKKLQSGVSEIFSSMLLLLNHKQ